MTTLHGEILPYLHALGAEDGSEEMLTAMKLVGTTFSIDEFTSMGVHEKYLVQPGRRRIPAPGRRGRHDLLLPRGG